MPARLQSWLAALIRRSRLESEMDEELRFHLEARADDLARAGVPRVEAERRARLEFGNVDGYKEHCREARGLRWPDELGQDLRFAFRSFRKNPGFAAVAVVTLALGIGANAAMFTLVESVLLRPLPYHDPARLVMVYSVGSFGPFSWRDGALADPDYLELRTLSAFSQLAAFTTFEASLTGAGEPVRALESSVTASFFPLLGVEPARGRGFREGEEVASAGSVAVLSDALWRSRFRTDPGVIGRVEKVDGVPHTIVGVMPPHFDFPPKTQVWTPLRIRPGYRDNAVNKVMGRLADGVSPAQAFAQASTLIGNIGWTLAPEKRTEVTIVGLQESMVGQSRRLLMVLLGAVGCVLLIACTNLASLLMARAAARGPEMSLRAILGARRGRLLRQLLTESLALAFMGGVLGLALAHASLPVLLRWVPPNVLPRSEEVHVDGAVLALGCALCLLTGLLFGIAPALSGSRRELRPPNQRGPSGGARAERRVHGALVIFETALVLVLLIGAGLLLKSFWKLMRVDPGFCRDRILTVSVSLPDRVYGTTEQKRDFYNRLLERLRAIPGAGDASAVNLVPFGPLLWQGDFAVEGQEHEPVDLLVGKPAVSESYFQTLGIPLLRGRAFDGRDGPEAPLVAIVSEAVARRCWPGQNAVGRRLTMDDPQKGWRTVVGVVGDVRQESLAAKTLPMIYVPLRQESRPFFLGSMTYLARAQGDPAATAAALRAQVRALDPELPVQRVELLDDMLSGSLAPPRFRTAALLTFALLALLVALVGIYGVTAYEVTRRTAEIGIRRALGAQTSAVLRLVVGRSLGLVLAGLAAGILGALAVTRVLEGFLFGVTPIDVTTFLVVSLALTAAATLASAGPARRAARVDPAVALRYD
jgi:predicted permease